WIHSTSRSSDRKSGEARASGWIDEQTSWTKPGSVSSAERRPPPSCGSASCTSTSNPARASVIAAASPFGPEPITTARFTPRLAPERSERRTKGLAALQDRLEQVAALRHSVERPAPAEGARSHLLPHVLPPPRCRNRRARLRPDRVDRGDGLPMAILAVVHENSTALLLEPLGRHEPRVLGLEATGHALRELVRIGVRRAPRDRHEHVNPVGAARLDVRAHLEPLERLADQGRDAHGLHECAARLRWVERDEDEA